ncbi:hypothetical protein ABEB36_004991 [Hypothenemus hampei]|uniref:Uncharacterized protein n=1 Tax=Hypothenemus hampei TaxID=57062 RepID=A0ABD1EWM6_HYPHA
MISLHDETQPETPPTSAATSPSLPSSPPPSSTISVEGSVDGSVAGSVDGIVKERIKKEKELPEQLLKNAISHYSDLRKTGANPDYDHIQKKAHFPSTYEGTRTTSMSLRCEILTTRAVQGKRLFVCMVASEVGANSQRMVKDLGKH